MSREIMKKVKRIVVKVGTNSIMKNHLEVDYRMLDRLAFVLATLRQQGYEIILVTSGAVGVGASYLEIEEYPTEIPDQQALSAIGQSALMALYSQFFDHYRCRVGQLLLTRDVVDHSISYENCHNALDRLIDMGVVPIINENDSVATDELKHPTKFGDNDTLSAIVAQIAQADLLVIMSDVDGLYDKNPAVYSDAKKIDHVPEVTQEIHDMAGGVGSEFARGGMATKIKAAERILNNDQAMIIMSAENPTKLFNVLEGETIGTLFKR
ncbi:glutamate 5-kinase [Dolosicoccus paucivorans]|uniref:Glutamate 5-kinase n=1 Tax=Dolosicoccus paucivorans TaxID=84521 RepID=A0A2N6SNM2_9LACT|nr:glutamate 5-kinase [Dolosicoccus paucivorans]PMB84214.1 glutamate 5-kinase [Dolosicoccus paucivorans]PMC58677.1 glutamate 5-kinase [Dolosicoccus paucivorans]